MSKKEITIIVSIILSMYLGGVFISMEFNPAKWNILGRVLYVLMAVIILAITFIDDRAEGIKRFK
jgi:predicted membrane channel-forming protein YqfA (hemolysin III family)